MADLTAEKLDLRKQIISAAQIYKHYLAGKVFLYVYGEESFEVAYLTECFKHLTGVESTLRGNSFYNNAKNATLTTEQIGLSQRHPLRTARKKQVCLHQLPQLTTDVVCVVKDMHTVSITYKLGISNLEFTVGLTENTDAAGNRINNWLIPRTLRINDKAIESSADAQFIDMIFSKNAPDALYSTVCYADPNVPVPNHVLPLLDEALKADLSAHSELHPV